MRQITNIPAITWLKITDYQHGWLQNEFGGIEVHNQRVVSVQHIRGAKEIMRMEAISDVAERKPIEKSMSDTRMNCLLVGMKLDANTTEQLYGIPENQIELFVPIECPRMCMTKCGVLRPWTLDVCMSREQATKLQQLIREEFWGAVTLFSKEYAIQQKGEYYPQVEMIEAFCDLTNTPSIYVETIRREWQRRLKRRKN